MSERSIFTNIARLWNMGFSISPPLIPGAAKGHTVERWKPYQTVRATPKQIYSWYQKYPDHNYAVITGMISQIVVLDADDEEAEKLVKSKCPSTPVMQVSGSGRGKHYIYRHPMIRQIRNVQKVNKFNLDIRGDGGLFVGPGSIHELTKLPYLETEIWTKELLSNAPIFNPSWLHEKSYKKEKKQEAWKKIVCQNQWKLR